MATTRQATAVWEGKLRDGRGTFKAGSGAFTGPYTFKTRFEGAKGTNPEELIAAAHAACLSMALAAGLERAGTPAERVSTRASATLEKVGEAFRITKIYPSETPAGEYRRGADLLWTVEPGDTVLLEITPLGDVSPAAALEEASVDSRDIPVQNAFLTLEEIVRLLDTSDLWPAAPLPGKANMPRF